MQRQSMLPTLQKSTFFIFPESVGYYYELPQHYVERPNGYNSYSLHFIVSGKGFVERDGIVHTLHKGDAFLYTPLQKQHYYSSKDDPWEIRWVHFYGAKLKEFLFEQGFFHNIWTLHRWSELEVAYKELLVSAETYGILHPAKLSAQTYAILAEFMSYAIPHTANRGIESTDRIMNLLPLMRQKACEPFLLEEWAEQVGVGTHYFCKLFRKSTSMTPVSFITLCRMQVAKQLLIEQTDLNIKDIALQAGYISASYFNEQFLKHEGMRPNEYRKLFIEN
ncbi:AraC family transcriptional regulator [Paenibacillus psychroresistens]|uniref:AraC family transcriptional regulator n=1 Tax=Paenibacillus psychroresistens TaxID=1778678 RepID=A0A6B8RRG5_9BACL|nr:helix-turn-helix domain-containing protein [Paenibacillus psychroresistens]QGQ98559.1 AraC family transcriptional regulator [Paenibacillus psychroresistens]